MAVPDRFRPWLTGGGAFLLLAAGLATPQSSQAVPDDGKRLFDARCAKCHGAGGKGGSGYPAPLVGRLTLPALTKFIATSMPPGPKPCPAAEATKIAGYMFGAFYSPKEKATPPAAPRDLARLTVRQFRNAVADLISGFHPAIPAGPLHGLHADYFKGRSRDWANRVIDRIDPNVDFDFGIEAPAKSGFDPRNFSIFWQGSVLAPDTGEYQFSIHSTFSCQLWVNDSRYPVVDGEVRSAGDPDPKGTITLLGGRAYTLRMVFTKATQGVDMPDKAKAKPVPPSFVSLRWRRPNHTDEVIPTQFLFPNESPKLYVPATPFPPDDRRMGFERGNGVSKEWDEATTAAALDASAYVVKNLPEVSQVPDNDKDRPAHLRAFCQRFVERAFRRPLTEELRRLYIDRQFAVASSPEIAVKRVVLLTLKSPRFLYREIGGQDPYTAASQLAFGLWDSLPDPELEQAAAEGRLVTREQLEVQANRMVQDNRAWNKVRQFLLLWLRLDEVPDIVKSPQKYPTFDATTASDLRTSLELFLQETAWSEAASYRDLMLTDKQMLNGRLAKLYGVPLPENAPFQPVALDPGERAGILTHPYLLSRFAYRDGSSPIHRGVLIDRNMLGRVLKPPPTNFVPLAASARPDLTTRERVALQTKPAFCAQCHSIINPLGYPLERFDAIGKLRTTENGKPVDTSGAYRARDGSLAKFGDAKALALYLAESNDAQGAFVEKLYLNVTKQSLSSSGQQTVGGLQASFAKNHYSIRRLLVDMAVTTAVIPPRPPALSGPRPPSKAKS